MVQATQDGYFCDNISPGVVIAPYVMSCGRNLHDFDRILLLILLIDPCTAFRCQLHVHGNKCSDDYPQLESSRERPNAQRFHALLLHEYGRMHTMSDSCEAPFSNDLAQLIGLLADSLVVFVTNFWVQVLQISTRCSYNICCYSLLLHASACCM